jgi:four helix bundle protein
VALFVRPAIAMGKQAEALKARTMRFALDICALIKQLPHDEPGPTVRRQLAKSSTSVAFNYRAACRGRSHAEYTAKIGVVAEESDETLGWLEFIEAGSLISGTLVDIVQEAKELCAIFSASYATARRRQHGNSG